MQRLLNSGNYMQFALVIKYKRKYQERKQL